jgi:uncharacterized membrane protein YgcG
MDWGLKQAALLLLPAILASMAIATFLWIYAGTDQVKLPWTMTAALTVMALSIANASINGMKSVQSREAIAFRKRLTTGRSFFLKELKEPRPDLRDRWYPWMLAFGLGPQVDFWSSHHTPATSRSSEDYTSSTSTTSSSTHGGTGWSGGGGLSGGAGASGTWAAAAAGMAAGVAAPSSNGSGSSSSSSGGSSGGGGGGGW